MLHSIRACVWAVACAASLLLAPLALRAEEAGAEGDAAASSEASNAAEVEFFEKHVRPILAARCHECHAGAKHKGNLRLDSRAAVMTGGDTGPALVPGKPDESLLVDAVRYGDTYQMPPTSQLAQAEIDTLAEWVRRGAHWGVETSTSQPAAPEQEFDLAARLGHWSFQPLAEVVSAGGGQ